MLKTCCEWLDVEDFVDDEELLEGNDRHWINVVCFGSSCWFVVVGGGGSGEFDVGLSNRSNGVELRSPKNKMNKY